MAGIDVISALLKYDALGFDTLPLIPGSKKPFAHSWQSLTMHRLWQNYPQDVNIGIRGGGPAHNAVIDCDSPQTFGNVANWLAGLGYQPGEYPTVRTASGLGRHIYTSFGGNLPGDWRLLSNGIGKGEFRFGSGSYVVAPPSTTSSGGSYALITGDFAHLPSLALDDIKQIIDYQQTQPAKKSILPRKAIALLLGNGIGSYKSRSEAEQALLVLLINAGFSFEDIIDLFNRNPCAGKYRELKAQNPRNAEHWLQHSFIKAELWAKTHESHSRRTVQAMITWAKSTPWPGKTGSVDRLIYIAHA